MSDNIGKLLTQYQNLLVYYMYLNILKGFPAEKDFRVYKYKKRTNYEMYGITFFSVSFLLSRSYKIFKLIASGSEISQSRDDINIVKRRLKLARSVAVAD